jgi:putative peptidoglycan lipid II flippase
MALLGSIATVGSYTMLSRILGFARDILIAAMLGAGPVADAFFVAFKLPNFFRRLFAEGAFNAAFIPLFTARLTEDGHDVARRFAEEVFAVLVVTLLLLCTAIQIAMPWAMHVFAPGFVGDPERFDLTVELTRITFPYLLFISLVSQLGGILNSLGRFAAAAATPILLNVSLIAAIVALTPVLETAGHALAWGVFAAGVIQFLWLIEACRRAGMTFRLPRPRINERVKWLLILILPGAIGAGVVQINLLIGIIIASLLPTGSVSYLYYADRIYQLPLGVIGVAVGTALLPLLSRQLRAGEEADAMASLNRALEFALFLSLPAAAALIVMPGPIVSVLFERGAFDAEAARATAEALIAFSIGVPAYVLVKVLAPGFFAREDTATPVKIAALCVALNIGLSVALMGPLLHVGIALAQAISSWVNAILLAVFLRRGGHLAFDRRLKEKLPRVCLASAGMAAALFAGAAALAPMLDGGTAARGAALTVLVVGGLVVYGGLALAVRAAAIADLRVAMRRQRA